MCPWSTWGTSFSPAGSTSTTWTPVIFQNKYPFDTIPYYFSSQTEWKKGLKHRTAEMQIKSSVCYRLTLLRIAIKKKKKKKKRDWRKLKVLMEMWRSRKPMHCWREGPTVPSRWTRQLFLKEWETEGLEDLATTLLSLCPQNNWKQDLKEIYTPIFTSHILRNGQHTQNRKGNVLSHDPSTKDHLGLHTLYTKVSPIQIFPA